MQYRLLLLTIYSFQKGYILFLFLILDGIEPALESNGQSYKQILH